jgi:hypothetical protein
VAPADHPYILAKQGRPDGLRVVPADDRLTIAGQAVAGWLAVPVVPLGDSVPCSLQFIPQPGAGKKLNLPGAPMAGAFIVGELVPGGVAFLTEGIGQAWACWKATGHPAVVCFGWGRVRTVAAELRERDADARLVIVPDVGKEQEAQEVARQARGQYVTLPAAWKENADVNDYALREGFDALEVLLSKAREPEQRFQLLGADELHALPTMVWRVRDVLPARGVASVYGPSASGKSFLVLDLGAAIAEGRAWFDYRVKAAPVVYVALEGEAGFSGRVRAWEQHHGRTLPAGLRMVMQPFKLTAQQDVTELAAAVCSLGDGAVVIIDTLNRAAPEADENASQDMGRILEAARELRAATHGLVLLVHHTGKDATKGLRGHSSLFAALDAAVEVSREGGRREWKSAKVKDGDDGAAHAFRLVTVDLGDDADGEAVTSCAVTADASDGELCRVLPPKSGNQRVVWDALGELLRKAGPMRPKGAPDSLPPGRPAVALDAAVDALRERLAVDPKRKTERAQQALTGLQAKGLISIDGGFVWVT